MFRTTLFSLSMLILLASLAAAQSRPQAYALNCIGFPGGQTKGLLTGFIDAGQSAYAINATCDSEVNGGASQSIFPAIPASAGPVTAVHVVLRTQRIVGQAAVSRSHVIVSSTGFVAGEVMAVPSDATGEVHYLVSIP